MSWIESHKKSEGFAAAAHEALRHGDVAQAQYLFGRAARAEQSALSKITPLKKPRTFGITAVSAVALWYKAAQYSRAQEVAYKALAIADIPPFAVEQLRGLLQTIWNVEAQLSAGVKFVPGQVLVSVKGGDIVTGGAPLDLIVDKVKTIQSLFYRTAEFLVAAPLRRRGPPSPEIQESCKPWLFQSVPGSYQFAVAIQGPQQSDLFKQPGPDPRLVASTFLSILESAAGDPGEGLTRLVPNDEYKATFLKLTRNLAPSGRVFSQMEIRAAEDAQAIVLLPDSRKSISQTLRSEAPPIDPQLEHLEPVALKGTLRGLHLDKDWLEITVEGEPVHVEGVGDTVDDVIGPMVNKPVTVHTMRDQKGKYRFRDVEPDE